MFVELEAIFEDARDRLDLLGRKFPRTNFNENSTSCDPISFP